MYTSVYVCSSFRISRYKKDFEAKVYHTQASSIQYLGLLAPKTMPFMVSVYLGTRNLVGYVDPLCHVGVRDSCRITAVHATVSLKFHGSPEVSRPLSVGKRHAGYCL